MFLFCEAVLLCSFFVVYILFAVLRAIFVYALLAFIN